MVPDKFRLSITVGWQWSVERYRPGTQICKTVNLFFTSEQNFINKSPYFHSCSGGVAGGEMCHLEYYCHLRYKNVVMKGVVLLVIREKNKIK